MEKVVNLIFKQPLPTVEEIYKRYSYRNLKPEQKITRVAPSPTGCVHIGTMYMALVCERVAHQSNGVFYLRIEDTDTKREVEGIAEKIPYLFKQYGIKFDEGYREDKTDFGNYGPYKQSQRKEIYNVFIKDLLLRGLAYPCFCSEQELENIVAQQKAQNCQDLGYYGGWAKYRNFPVEETIKKLEAGEQYVIRFKSNGNSNKKIIVHDVLKGNVELPENKLDIVIMKKDGLPTYHFAHIIDDFLMGTNLVIRGDEWLPSLPLHIQMFQTIGWKAPQYAHVSPILKIDESGGKRKLSKRKDPEANVEYFDELGYPKVAILEYLLNLANSNFEDWRRQNPLLPYTDFNFSIKRMNTSGALFDFVKLSSVSREIIGRMKNTEIYDLSIAWAEKYNQNLYKLMKENKEYCLKILNIERENTKKVRKDLAKWSDLEHEIKYFFEVDKGTIKQLLNQFDSSDVREIVNYFIENYSIDDDNDKWFDKVKTIAEKLNYATNLKDYKEHPNNFKGSVSDVAKILRIVITAREQSPNLCEIMKILGTEESLKRLKECL